MIKKYSIPSKILTKQFKLLIIDPKRINPKSLNTFINKITAKEEKDNYNIWGMTMANLYALQY